MHSRSIVLASIASFLSGLHALTITSPSGGFLDPTQIITVTWTHTASDPATFNLVFDTTDGGLAQTVGSGISTTADSFQIPAGTVSTWGSTFVLTAQDASGNTLGKSGTFGLAQGVFIQTTDANGGVTLVSSGASEPTAGPTTASSMVVVPNTPQESSTTTGAVTGTTASNSFMTSTTTTSRLSSTSRSTSSSATATTSANAQPRLGKSGEVMLSAAGVIAGLVALFA